MEISPFRQSFRTFQISISFSFRQSPFHTCIDALPRTSFLLLDHMLAQSHGFTTLARTCYELPLAAAFVMKTVEVLGGCDCGGKVILDVEAVSPRGVTERRGSLRCRSWAHNL